ncbi:hypothetical protein [uncultured Tateyamaria sp.]|uniref:hypothetical protein n=1 Tax=uncultured Tateyamaria sp. TaxID=455651 RepID=UPI00261562A2|nr:hypothetical protein [uncultured Tateyamaria sp.]
MMPAAPRPPLTQTQKELLRHRQKIFLTGASRSIDLLTAQALAADGHKDYAGMPDIAGCNQTAASGL